MDSDYLDSGKSIKRIGDQMTRDWMARVIFGDLETQIIYDNVEQYKKAVMAVVPIR